MKELKFKNLNTSQLLPVLLIVINFAILFQSIFLPPKVSPIDGVISTRYNNYLIFKHSFFHLFENLNLYIHHLEKHQDLFKYSPTFALLMGPFTVFPDTVGLLLWNLLNTFVLYFAIHRIPSLSPKAKVWIVLFVLFELITSLRNSQSNALIAGMLIYAFVFLEKNKTGTAILLIIGSAFIKIFGVVALLLVFLYPQKIRSAAYAVLWTTVLILLPVLFIPLPHLIQQYVNWGDLLQNDHSLSLGLSVMGWLQSWFNILGMAYKSEIVLVGAVLMCLPFLFVKRHAYYHFRLLALCSLLLWIVIFNHRAESPTFIIAAVGAAIWYFDKPANPFDTTLIVLTFILTVLSPTDLFPRYLRDNYVVPYVLKAVPCIFVWIRIWYLMITPGHWNQPSARS